MTTSFIFVHREELLSLHSQKHDIRWAQKSIVCLYSQVSNFKFVPLHYCTTRAEFQINSMKVFQNFKNQKSEYTCSAPLLWHTHTHKSKKSNRKLEFCKQSTRSILCGDYKNLNFWEFWNCPFEPSYRYITASSIPVILFRPSHNSSTTKRYCCWVCECTNSVSNKLLVVEWDQETQLSSSHRFYCHSAS